MRSFENLMTDLEKGNFKMVFDLDKYKEVLQSPQKPKILSFQMVLYLTFNTPLNEKIPSIKQIAKDLKMEIEAVKEGIKELKRYGVLEEIKEKEVI